MMKKLDRVVLELAKVRKEWDDACPDVGMGPSLSMILDDAMESADIKVDEIDYALVLKKLKETYR